MLPFANMSGDPEQEYFADDMVEEITTALSRIRWLVVIARNSTACRGLFSARGGGGGSVYTNRPQLGPWETWNLIDNNDGSVSFQSVNGHYLCAERGGGSFCAADRTAIGGWERFVIEGAPYD